MPSKNRELPRNLTGPGIRHLRSQPGLTQAELAARCGSRGWDISRDVVARIEEQVRWASDAFGSCCRRLRSLQMELQPT